MRNVKIAMSWLFHISVYSRDQITDFVEDFIPGILNEEKDIREKEKMITQLKKELNELKSKKRLWGK